MLLEIKTGILNVFSIRNIVTFRYLTGETDFCALAV